MSTLSFVACASNSEVLGQRLLASNCLHHGGWPLAVYFNASSAAHGFNSAMVAAQMVAAQSTSANAWLVWVHQDVFLPEHWDSHFMLALDAALQRFPKLAVAGVYGVAGAGENAKRAGHVLDRGTLLRESAPLPCLVDSLDELLFAVRVHSGLRLDPALGFDFYATDLVLQAQQQGWQCAVVDACCEHWSDTPASGAIPTAVVQRIKKSANIFERKWARWLPISTPCFEIARAGDVAAFIESIVLNSP
ncbi:MAG: hypothetical protein ACOYNF_20605 [Rhodoferax sp.]